MATEQHVRTNGNEGGPSSPVELKRSLPSRPSFRAKRLCKLVAAWVGIVLCAGCSVAPIRVPQRRSWGSGAGRG